MSLKAIFPALLAAAMADPHSELHRMAKPKEKTMYDEAAAERFRHERAARKLANWNRRNGL